MGSKSIWDGIDLPEKGDEVLIHLARSESWIRHTVTGYRIDGDLGGSKWLHRVFIVVGKSDDPRSGDNERLLAEVKPLDWRPEGEVPLIEGAAP